MKINFGSVKEKLSGGKKGKPKKKWLKIVIALVLIAVILISILLWRSAQARQAAADAIAGSNPVGDCLYFGNGNWGIQIGDHYFH